MGAEIQTLQRGLASYRAGRLGEAERLYGEVLRRNPSDPDALHLLGLLYLDQGNPQAAAGLAARAIQERPHVPLFYNTLGNALRGLRRLEPAILSFRNAISLEPEFVEALVNLGSALEESGHATEGVAFHRRALELRPESAEIHGNLGNALRSAGRPEEAMAAYETALRLKPDFAEAWMNLGNLDFDRGAFARAERNYREALRRNPRLHAAKSNLGAALAQMGSYREAEGRCREALEATPDDAAAQVNLASVLARTGQPEAAEQLCRRALEAHPGMPEAHTNLGLALARLHRLAEAEAQCGEALRLRPGQPSGYANLAQILILTGRFEDAEWCLRRALELVPNYSRALGGLGDLCAAQLDYAGAIAWYERCRKTDPESDSTLPARAMARLAMGDFALGWEEYESRWTLAECPRRGFTAPEWDGAPYPGRTLMLHAEQGLGDTIQFVRFARMARHLGGRVVLACQAALAPVLARVAGVDEAVPDDGPLPEFDLRLALLSLPRVLASREDTIPRAVPYLQPSAEAIDRARRRLEDLAGARDGSLRVGLVWAGSPKHPNDSNRSLRLERLAPLLEVAQVQFFSLQQDRAIPERARLLRAIREDDSVDTTAAIMGELDLVITVDSMMAHLAGALARPVWVLLPFAPDWRWMTGRDDSPWYPTMRLFRQPRFGDWEDVVQRVRAELVRRTAGTAVLGESFSQGAGGHPDKEISGAQFSAAPAGRRQSNL